MLGEPCPGLRTCTGGHEKPRGSEGSWCRERTDGRARRPACVPGASAISSERGTAEVSLQGTRDRAGPLTLTIWSTVWDSYRSDEGRQAGRQGGGGGERTPPNDDISSTHHIMVLVRRHM